MRGEREEGFLVTGFDVAVDVPLRNHPVLQPLDALIHQCFPHMIRTWVGGPSSNDPLVRLLSTWLALADGSRVKERNYPRGHLEPTFIG